MDGGQAAIASPSERDIERVVQALRRVERESAWERTLEVGRLVFQGIVAGNERDWRSRRGHKEASLRKLVAHGACPYKKSTLCAAVNVLLFVQKQPRARQLSGVTPTHIVQVLALPPEEAWSMLARASQEGASARELGRTVRAARKALGERRGRPLAQSHERAETIGRRVTRDLRAMHALLSTGECADETSSRRLGLLLEEISELSALLTGEAEASAPVFLPIAKVAEPALELRALAYTS